MSKDEVKEITDDNDNDNDNDNEDVDCDNGKDEVIEGLDDDDGDSYLTIGTADGELFQVPKKIGFMSNFIKTTFEGDKTAKVIELKEESLTKVCFGKILEYMAYHFNNPAKEIDQPLKNKNMKENVSEWDADFIDIPISNKDLLFALTNSANYLDVKPLLELCCAKIASELEGRTTEEMRKILNVVNDFTPEEEQELIERDKWLDECDK